MKTVSKGRFLVFEGIDGSGKSELSARLSDYLNSEGIETILTAEPSDSWIGDTLRSETKLSGPIANTLFYVADRAEHTSQIKKWLNSGKWVICDRYVGSTLAYQGAVLADKVENAWDWIKEVNRPAIIPADITFLLRISPELAMERLSLRASSPTRFEKLNFLKKVCDNYEVIAEDDSSYCIIDASQSRDEVFSSVIKRLF
ncbi:dTMP kinase [Candidatus Methanomassiliicoccus intestinalis]|uniref:dTMP kinase n=1 Tax=Candidatus Methanomassiliicoccus intestinalis TaxID=1406512 RepID=UPI0037DC3118